MPLGRPVEPDEYIQNAMSSRWVSASGRSVGEFLQPLLRNESFRHGVFAGGAIDDDQGSQRRVLAGLGIEPRA